MIRLASWIIASLVIAAGIVWVASLPGNFSIEVLGWRAQPRLGIAIAIGLGALVLLIFMWSLIRRVMTAPRALARRSRERRNVLGIEALSDGFIALQSGDAGRARALARDAQARLPNNAAAQLLEARADLALGDMPTAREHYRALLTNQKTALAALSGLYDQAAAQGRREAALTFARKAVDISPLTPWAHGAVLDDLTRRGAWAEALALVASEPTASKEQKAHKRRRQAVIETARAREAESSEPLAALDHALTALKLLPDFVPAALIAARIHANRGEARKAMSLLRRAFRSTGHPDVATLYANAVPGSSAIERLRRVREIIDVPVADRGAALVLARAAIDAFEWALARNALAPFSAANPTQSVCLLMAEIEEGQTGDQGKAREWLNRAVRAPRDPLWVADGITADEWEPVSPLTGRLDAFEWKVPVTAVNGKAGEPLPAPPAAATQSLPAPVATADPSSPAAKQS